MALAVLAGCSGSAPAADPAAPSAAPSTTSSDRPTTADLEALYWTRQQEAAERYTEADVAFMTGMIGHHAQALIMSDLAPANGASPAVQRLAARIINAQQDEIALMQRWLADRGQPVPHVHIEGTMLTLQMVDADEHVAMDHHTTGAIHHGAMEEGHGGMDHGATAHEGMDHGQMDHAAMDHAAMGHEGMDHGGMDHGGMDHGGMDHGGMDHGGMDHGGMDHSAMPGMLTQAQLDELAAARGVDFDRLFLRYMIGHHRGAVTMVDTLFAADGAAQGGNTFKVASDIQVDQRTEIARMQQMLDSLPRPAGAISTTD
ncbi:hypothetical protein B1759_08120 [Rubrivirga sp. SAORIC476]|uniref:DUF305 domain-containing protein n=1 Tax=Rubrivirga sp. SAORIC476 TaxID=1961794 RepID=UPI000BCB9999|nr:DUF305 domain-containing protein [Rubrivirga sp. SAORIC476]PAP81288.1 hypothetical protein B1759_08120 [Rubrivirga sp. SAORIC476]